MDAGYSIDILGGSCPVQATGRLNDGRPFYFRARHGEWEIGVGPPDAASDGPWIGETRWRVAGGADPTEGYMPEAEVRAVLQEHLGQ